MPLFELIGAAAGALTVLIYLPQVVQTVRTQSTHDLSLPTYILSVTSAVLWVVYGIYKDAPSIWVANGLVAVLACVILVVKIRRG